MPDAKTSIITAIIAATAAIFGALGGAYLKGDTDLRLAEQKFYSDLVLKAMESPDRDARIATLEMMIETNLIKDASIKEGVGALLKKTKADPEGSPIPQVLPDNAEIVLPAPANNRIYLLSGFGKVADGLEPLKRDLIKAQYNVIGSNPLRDKERPDGPEVRYFNPGDRDQAVRLAMFMGVRTGRETPARVYQDASAKPGYIEIWLGR